MEKIYKENAKIVYQYIFCLCRDEMLAEEITQETFVIAIKKIHQFKGECKVSVWLCQIAKHLWYKELKRKKKSKLISMEETNLELISHDLEEAICQKEERLNLLKDIQKLDGKTKEVIYLRIMGNLSFEEIGQIVGKTANWARVTFYRGKEKIKEERKHGKKDRM